MVKDPSLFSSLDYALENNIFATKKFALNITRHDDVSCQHVQIVGRFHVPSLSTNLSTVFQLTQTGKIVEFWLNKFFIKNLKDRLIIADGLLDPKD